MEQKLVLHSEDSTILMSLKVVDGILKMLKSSTPLKKLAVQDGLVITRDGKLRKVTRVILKLDSERLQQLKMNRFKMLWNSDKYRMNLKLPLLNFMIML